MRDYHLSKYHMNEQMRQADNARLAQQVQRSSSLINRLQSLWNRTASWSNTGTVTAPAQRLEPTTTH